MLTPHLRVAPRSRLETLRRLSLFADLSDAELRLADSLMCEIDVAPGTAFIKQRQVGREAFVITAGTAEVTIDGVPVARLGPGDLVGETALLTDASRSATVTALTPASVLVLDRGQFAELVREPRIAHTVDELESRRRGAPGLHLVSGSDPAR